MYFLCVKLRVQTLLNVFNISIEDLLNIFLYMGRKLNWSQMNSDTIFFH